MIAGQRRTVVDEDSRQIEPRNRHHHSWHRLIASPQNDDAVKSFCMDYCFDRVTDNFSTHQRGPHALVSHRNTVGDGDRPEFESDAT